MKNNMEAGIPSTNENSAEAAPSFAELFIQEVNKEYKKLLTDNESRELRNHFELGGVIHRRLNENNPQEVLARDLTLRTHAAHIVLNRVERTLNGSTEDKHRRDELERLEAFFDALPALFNVLSDLNNQEKYAPLANVVNKEAQNTYERFKKEILKKESSS